MIFQNRVTHFLVHSHVESRVRDQNFFHFFVLESPKIDAAAPPIIIPVTSLSIPHIPFFTVFLLFLNIIGVNYDSILFILIFWLSKRIFGMWITSKLFSITAFTPEKSIFSQSITFLRNLPQKHSSFFTCISCS